jgi:hypothetical protein
MCGARRASGGGGGLMDASGASQREAVPELDLRSSGGEKSARAFTDRISGGRGRQMMSISHSISSSMVDIVIYTPDK